MFYRANNELKIGVKIKVGLSKSRYDLLKRANDHVKETKNCRLNVKFNDENQKDIFFSSFDDLKDIVDKEL